MTQPARDALQNTKTGIRLHVRVTPRAKKTQFAGIVADEQGRAAVAIRLAAPPVDGAANQALLDFLKTALNLGRNQLTLVSGEASRFKTVEIAGDAENIARRLDVIMGQTTG